MTNDNGAGAADAARLLELQRLHILDSEPERQFDAIVETAASLFDAPVALITLLDKRRQWFKAAHGAPFREAPREAAFCERAIATPDRVMIVSDLALDAEFCANPFVVGEPHVRFYAGAPLISRNGVALGTLCVLDLNPRPFSERDASGLRALANLTMQLLEERADRTVIAPDALFGRIVSGARSAAFAWDERGRVTGWNRAAEAAFGWSAAEALGSLPPILLAEDVRRFRTDCIDTLTGENDVVRLSTVRTKAGRRLAASLTMTRTIDAGGKVAGLTIAQDIGARIVTEQRLTMLESVVGNSTDVVIVTDAVPAHGVRDRIVYVNEAFSRLTGYSAAEAVGNTPRMLQGPKTDLLELRRISEAIARRESVRAEVVNYTKDSREYWVEFNISPVFAPDGECLYFVAIERETTERRAVEIYEANRGAVLEMAIRNESLEKQLDHIVRLLRGVVPGSRCTVMLLDGEALKLNAADPLLPPAYLRAVDGLRIGPNSGSCGAAAFTRTAVLCGDIATDRRWEQYRDLALSAGVRACWSVPIFGTRGEVLGAFALYADRVLAPTVRDLQWLEDTARFAALVIERHRDRERLEQTVLYDPLTSLPNRTSFETRCTAALDRAKMNADAVAVGVLDIDRFKTINDAFGHHVGDELLRQVADRLSAKVRGADILARMSGDEFLVAFTDLANEGDGLTAARRLIAAFQSPFSVEGYEIFVRVSFGLAFFPQASTDFATLLRAADQAMYAAKARGGGFEVATALVEGAASAKLDLENDLHHALERGEFELHYQMMFDLADGRPAGAEALLRWNHPRLGRVAPGDFIPLAEANGTIVAIGQWVIAQAAAVAREWQDAGRDAFVAVNVSALQFEEPGLIATVVDALEREGLEPRRLHLELTESLVMRNPAATASTLAALNVLGVQIDIDDFGTGYSSLAYLQRFTFDALKIDRAFVRGIGEPGHGGRSEQIVRAVVDLAKALGVRTIVEGVETPEQYAYIRSCGCDLVQGFLCALPVPAAELVWAHAGAALALSA